MGGSGVTHLWTQAPMAFAVFSAAGMPASFLALIHGLVETWLA